MVEPVENADRLTEAGHRHLQAVGLDIGTLRHQRRAFARPCLDWTERRPHLGGALGAAIAHHLLEREWLMRTPGSRALRITDDGRVQLRELFGLNFPAGGPEDPV